MNNRRLFGDYSTPCFLDTSVLINLESSGCAERILSVFPSDVFVAASVENDLIRGLDRGHHHAKLLEQLLSENRVQKYELRELSQKLFEELVTGSAAQSLDDGEAATIACAIETGGYVVLDEQKARRICRERFHSLQVLSTTEVFLCYECEELLGKDLQIECLHMALKHGRMNVPPDLHESVVELLGATRAAECTSIPARYRLSHLTGPT